MRNIQKLANCIVKNGGENIIVHTIPSTKNWIVAQKTEINKWCLNLMDPMGETVYELGSITNEEHLKLWTELIKMEIEKKAELILKPKRTDSS